MSIQEEQGLFTGQGAAAELKGKVCTHWQGGRPKMQLSGKSSKSVCRIVVRKSGCGTLCWGASRGVRPESGKGEGRSGEGLEGRSCLVGSWKSPGDG